MALWRTSLFVIKLDAASALGSFESISLRSWVDASKSGVGAACLQDGFPVAYASRALAEAETWYAQIEELFPATFAWRKFHDFIYRRQAIIETDDKPLHSDLARVADTLLRAYINENSDPEADKQIDILSLTSITPARMAELQRHTAADPVMQKVTHFITNGWPAKANSISPEV